EGAQIIVDVATLTGAAIVALGNTTTAVLSNDAELFKKVTKASDKSGERIWQLPSFPEYRELNKTPLADLKNTGGRGAGTITAGLFIEEFVEEKPWLHLDIAGTAFTDKDRDYLREGATGVGVRLLYHFAEEFLKS
ncbi:MAG: aminopeptidase, partial [Firmicutes bacterium]|nr:aminopeptidase [Bacillota bacterium]